MTRDVIHSPDAPAAIGPYSQAIRVGHTVYLSGQIGLDPKTGNMVEGVEAQAHQVFRNLRAVAAPRAATSTTSSSCRSSWRTSADFAKVNEIMAGYFKAPYPARATYQVAALPRGALIEVEGTLVLAGAGGSANRLARNVRPDEGVVADMAVSGSREAADRTPATR